MDISLASVPEEVANKSKYYDKKQEKYGLGRGMPKWSKLLKTVSEILVFYRHQRTSTVPDDVPPSKTDWDFSLSCGFVVNLMSLLQTETEGTPSVPSF